MIGENRSRRKTVRISLALILALSIPGGVSWAELQETPAFADHIAQGRLPDVAERLPKEPAVAELETIGTPGGELRMLMGGPKDTRMMVVYGYARLVGYTPSLKFAPDILKSIEMEDNRVFTLHLRKGHKWSDGQPFTTEDFR